MDGSDGVKGWEVHCAGEEGGNNINILVVNSKQSLGGVSMELKCVKIRRLGGSSFVARSIAMKRDGIW